MLDEEMVAAWREAAAQFGIRVIAPYSIAVSDGVTVQVEAFLPDFGGPNGAIELIPHDPGWRGQFQREAAQIGGLLGDIVVAIHHIGSTAIPGIF